MYLPRKWLLSSAHAPRGKRGEQRCGLGTTCVPGVAWKWCGGRREERAAEAVFIRRGENRELVISLWGQRALRPARNRSQLIPLPPVKGDQLDVKGDGAVTLHRGSVGRAQQGGRERQHTNCVNVSRRACPNTRTIFLHRKI